MSESGYLSVKSHRDTRRKSTFDPFKDGGLSDRLAKKFWMSVTEDPWDSRQEVYKRWWKLVAVYWIAAIIEIALPVAIVGAVYQSLTNQAWLWVLIGASIPAVGGVLVAMLAATRTCLRISRERRPPERQ